MTNQGLASIAYEQRLTSCHETVENRVQSRPADFAHFTGEEKTRTGFELLVQCFMLVLGL